MSEHEKRLRLFIEHMPVAVMALDALLAEQRVTGLDDAIGFFKDKQKELDRQRTAAKSLSNAEIADMKTEAGRCGWAAQKLRDLKGRRKKAAKG